MNSGTEENIQQPTYLPVGQNAEHPKTAEAINLPQIGSLKVFPATPLAGRRDPRDATWHRRAEAEAAKQPVKLKHGAGVRANHPGHKGAVEEVKAAIAADTALLEHQKAFILAEIELLQAKAVQVGFHPSQGKDDRFGGWHVKRLF